MDQKAVSTLSIPTFAALLYYSEVEPITKDTKQFEDLTDDERKLWSFRAVKILSIFEKLGFAFVPTSEVERAKQSEAKTLELLTSIIQEFVSKLNTTKPALFPSAELAHRILRGKT